MKKILLILLVILAACTPHQQAVELSDYKCPNCNVILISIDTFRGDHLSCTGYNPYAINITENICRFASNGVLFTHAISQASSTEPSHASIMTSAIPSHHQAFNRLNQTISKDYPTLAEVLREKGFQTGAFTGAGQVSARYGFDRGFDTFVEFKEYVATHFSVQAESGILWLNTTPGQKFLFLHTYEIHHPYTPSIENAAELKENYNGTLGNNISLNYLEKVNNGTLNASQADISHVRAMYDAEILSMDRGFGGFIEQLKEIGIYNNTIIILTSDHGEEFGEHGKVGWHSHALYNELLHVPLIIEAPGLKQAVSDKLVQGIDIAPTLLNILNITAPSTYEGKPLFLGDSYAISEQENTGIVPHTVQNIEIKYYFNRSKKMLFNLTNDEKEQKDIAAGQSRLKDSLEQLYNETVSKPYKGTAKANISDQLREQLRSLGYVG